MISEAYAPRGSKGLEVGRVCVRPKACQVSPHGCKRSPILGMQLLAFGYSLLFP
jgi:hypothetical protein